MAASPRPPSWAIEHTEFNAGVLGETALPRRVGEKVLTKGIATHVPRLRDALSRAKAAKPRQECGAQTRVGKEDWLLEIGDWLLGRGLLTLRSQTLLRS